VDLPMTAYAFYDLAVSPVSFDVMAFLAMAKDWADAQGERLHVVIVPGRYDGFRADHKPISVAEKQFRLQHIVLPASHAIGATTTVCADRAQAKLFPSANAFPPGYSVDRPTARYSTGAIIAHGKAIGRSPAAFMPSAQALAFVDTALAKLFGAAARPVVITLRESYVDIRNSNMAAWIAFAERLQAQGQPVVIVRDTDSAGMPCDTAVPQFPLASLDLDVRLALYERAFVNMAVSGGPPFLNVFSARRPYLLFKMQVEGWNATSAEYLTKIGLPPGSQLSWAGPHQRIIWADDDLATLVAAYENFCATAPTATASAASPAFESSRLPLLRSLHEPEEILAETPLGREVGGATLAILLGAVCEYMLVHAAKTVLDYWCGRAMAYRARNITGSDGVTHLMVEDYWGVEQISLYDPAYGPYAALPDGQRDVVLAMNVLERLPEAELDDVLADIFARARRGVFFAVADYDSPINLADGSNLVCTRRPGTWWRDRIAAAAHKRPDCRWVMIYLPEDPLPAVKEKRPALHEKYTG
jgi:hypothetical protein